MRELFVEPGILMTVPRLEETRNSVVITHRGGNFR